MFLNKDYEEGLCCQLGRGRKDYRCMRQELSGQASAVVTQG